MGCNQSHIESENEGSLRAHLTHTKTNNGKFTLSLMLSWQHKKEGGLCMANVLCVAVCIEWLEWRVGVTV